MPASRLLAEFDRICDVPDSISRLRRLVPQLAVRGRLVLQEQSRSAVDDLLTRMEAEKDRSRMARANGAGRGVDFPPPFPIPQNWTWCRLSDVGAVVGGGTPPAADPDNFADGGTAIAWLTPADLGRHGELLISHGTRDLTPAGLRASSATLLPPGTVLFTRRAPIGYTAIAANEISTNQGFKSVVPFVSESTRYIEVYLRAFADWINEHASGTTFREAPAKLMVRLPFPLPPLEEQLRIVERVDELTQLCDSLESAQAEREATRTRASAASLWHLVQSNATSSSKDGAGSFLANLGRLITRPEDVTPLRETIIALAVRGRLSGVEVVLTESASDLLSRLGIAASEDESFAVPASWAWIELERSAGLVLEKCSTRRRTVVCRAGTFAT